MTWFRRSSHTARINTLKIDVYKLHKCTENHPVEKAAIKEFKHELEYPCWSKKIGHDDSKENKVRPTFIIDVLAEHGFEGAAKKYPELAHHFEQVKKADISYPIHVYKDIVIDGMHRLAKLALAYRTHETSSEIVLVKRLKRIPKEAIIT